MKIDGIPQENIENKNEQRWFSLIKFKAKEVEFGELSFKLTIRNGQIAGVRNITKEKHFIIGLDK
jgi:hypothetical protein